MLVLICAVILTIVLAGNRFCRRHMPLRLARLLTASALPCVAAGFRKFVVHNVSDLELLLMHNRCVALLRLAAVSAAGRAINMWGSMSLVTRV